MSKLKDISYLYYIESKKINEIVIEKSMMYKNRNRVVLKNNISDYEFLGVIHNLNGNTLDSKYHIILDSRQRNVILKMIVKTDGLIEMIFSQNGIAQEIKVLMEMKMSVFLNFIKFLDGLFGHKSQIVYKIENYIDSELKHGIYDLINDFQNLTLVQKVKCSQGEIENLEKSIDFIQYMQEFGLIDEIEKIMFVDKINDLLEEIYSRILK